MKYVGIDYGLVRTGLAVSDPEGRMAFPLTTLSLRDFPDRKALLAVLAARIAEAGAAAVVMGLPLHADGSESETAKQVRNVTKRIRRRIALPVYFMPELLSSEEAFWDMRQAGVRADRLRAVLDQQAAVRILASFLSLPPDRRRLA
ncbi:MAG: Holliday junction resolvase RuvX [Desulfovibrio sp.]|nr:Holliday junction resolvase RuvX [Desulfovibrio sp.]